MARASRTTRKGLSPLKIALVQVLLCLGVQSALSLSNSSATNSAGGPPTAAPFHPAQGNPALVSGSPILSQLQQQAQRQFSQFNGLVLGAVQRNGANANGSQAVANVFEALSSVGKAIQQQISAAASPSHVNIVTGPGSSGGLSSPGALFGGELANSKKNEYQSIGGDQQAAAPLQLPASGALPQANSSAPNYREQSELLRQEIAKRAGQLQQVVASSIELLKNNGDLIVRRLLEQMSARLDQAKAKADKIVNSEPVGGPNEMAVKALVAINAGLNNLHTIISNIVSRMELASKQDGGQRFGLSTTATGTPQLLDPNRLRQNLQQLGQTFQQAINGSQLHQQLALIRNQRLQLEPQPPTVLGTRINSDFGARQSRSLSPA